ncbi:MAG: DUF433 domain-containing protein [Gemmataceae bacterium]|nr:DUF433 domain-containing protein [Gemmataceae bacterium]MCI0739043.1 DUF433 domain-containing protein [Gemmataceae bacterium]
MKNNIEIVDRGRGPQLSTSRITVQDLVPYLQQRWSHESILEIMPVLSVEEIEAVEAYVRDHFDEVMEQDRRIRARNSKRENPPEVEEILKRAGEKMATLREQFAQERNVERNGDPAR